MHQPGRDGVTVSEVCCRYAIAVSAFYRWRAVAQGGSARQCGYSRLRCFTIDRFWWAFAKATLTARSSDRDCLMGRRKVSALRELAVARGWLDPKMPLPADATLSSLLGEPPRAGSTISTVEPYRAQVNTPLRVEDSNNVCGWCYSESRIRSSESVTTHRQIAVSQRSESQDHVTPQTHVSRRIRPPGVIGLAGTLLLRRLAIQTAVLGSRANRISAPEIREVGSSQSKIAPEESLAFIDIPNVAKPRSDINLSARATTAANPVRVTTAFDETSLTPSNDKELESSNVSGGSVGHARMLGVYAGQIQAPVKRVWSRPRTRVNDAPRTLSGARICRSLSRKSRASAFKLSCIGIASLLFAMVGAVHVATPSAGTKCIRLESRRDRLPRNKRAHSCTTVKRRRRSVPAGGSPVHQVNKLPTSTVTLPVNRS